MIDCSRRRKGKHSGNIWTLLLLLLALMIATSFKGNNFILQVPGNANHQVIVGTNGPNRHGLIPVTKLINVQVRSKIMMLALFYSLISGQYVAIYNRRAFGWSRCKRHWCGKISSFLFVFHTSLRFRRSLCRDESFLVRCQWTISMRVCTSVTRSGDLLDYRQLF